MIDKAKDSRTTRIKDIRVPAFGGWGRLPIRPEAVALAADIEGKALEVEVGVMVAIAARLSKEFGWGGVSIDLKGRCSVVTSIKRRMRR